MKAPFLGSEMAGPDPAGGEASSPLAPPMRRAPGALGRSILLRSFYLVLSVTLMMGVVALAMGFNAYREARLNTMHALIDDLAPSIAHAAWQINDTNVKGMLRTLAAQAEASRVAFDGDFQHFVLPEPPLDPNLCEVLIRRDLTGMSVGDTTLPSGMITVCYRHQALDLQTMKALALSALPMLAAIFITSFGFFLIVQRMIIARIYALTAQVKDDSFLLKRLAAAPDDELTQLSAALRDRTRRLYLEREIAWAVFKNIDDGVIVTDGQMSILRWNAHAAQMLRAPEIKGGQTRLQDVIHPDMIAVTDRWIEMPTPDDRHLSLFLIRLTFINDRPGYVVVIRDQTEKKRLEREAIHAHRMSAIGSLSSGVAHDFNNFLAVIIGNVELLQRRPGLDERSQRLLGATLNAARRGAALTDQLLTFARKQSLKKRLLKPSAMLPAFVDMSERVVGASARLEAVCETDNIVSVDPAYLETALLNLVINARDAMTGRGGTITVSARDGSLNDRPYVVFAVRDEGVGIPKELISKVSEPFFTTKQGSAGTGLGLSMVTGFAEQSGGFLDIKSQPGETVMSIWLPAARPEGEVLSKGDDGRPLDSIPPLNVLVVDDQQLVANTLSEHLTGAGHRVVTAASKEETAALPDLASFDLVLCDVVLVGHSGLEIWRLFTERGLGTPFIFVSGNVPQNLMAPLAATGAPLLRKPFSGMDLLAAVSGAARRS